MDLIVSDAIGNDIEVVKGFSFDLAYGSSENDFELKMPIGDSLYKEDYRLYVEGTEYGGIIDEITVDTQKNVVTYYGRTWHGILNSRIICPEADANYYTMSGSIQTWLASYLSTIGLDWIFEVPEQTSKSVTSYQFYRYCTFYTSGILNLFSDNNLKLILKYSPARKKVQMFIEDRTLYSDTEEFSSDRITFKMRKNYNQCNHLICLGKGELKERTRVDLYADADGNISKTQTLTGEDEVATVYEYSNAEDETDLETEGMKRLKELRTEDSIGVSIRDDGTQYDIGDKIEQTEQLSGIRVAEEITKKIVTIEDDNFSVKYEIGGTSLSSSRSSESSAQTSGGGGGTVELSHVGMVIHTTTLDTEAKVIEVYGGSAWTKIEGMFLLGASSGYAVNSTGGEPTHTLTIDEIPSHKHDLTTNTSSVSQYSSAYAGADFNSSDLRVAQSYWAWSGTHSRKAIGYTGGSLAHNNMPPYKAVYIWERTA